MIMGKEDTTFTDPKKNIVLLVQRMPHCCSLRMNDMAKYSGKQR